MIADPCLSRLNLGAGSDIRDGWINVDLHGDAECKHDLNQTPWPWANDSVGCAVMCHVLEHLPNTIGVMKELHRVCASGAEVHVRVPHPRHDDYLSDPTHVRPITIGLLHLFSKKKNLEWKKMQASNTPLALIHDVDFEIVREQYRAEKSWMDKVSAGQITEEQLREAILLYNNVIREIDVVMKVIK